MRRQPLNLIDNRVACPACGKRETSVVMNDEGGFEKDGRSQWVCDLCHYQFETDLEHHILPSSETQILQAEGGSVSGLVLSEEPVLSSDEPIHDWFELSYANYLTLPRSLLEAMPVEWQKRFVSLFNELEAEFPVSWPPEGKYRVSLVGSDGRFLKDSLAEYRRPDTFLIESLRRVAGEGE